MILIFTDLNSSNNKVDLKKLVHQILLCIVVGPEGDFSENEREEILSFKGVQPIKINENILEIRNGSYFCYINHKLRH